PPSPCAAHYAVAKDAPDQFTITLTEVNFNDQAKLLFNLRLIWKPDQKTKDAIDEQYKKDLATYTERKRRLQHADYVNAIRERVKLAGAVTPRRSEDLREEERTVIFRRLIHQLTDLDVEEPPHVTSELVRAIFDVEAMLYFVAPE